MDKFGVASKNDRNFEQTQKSTISRFAAGASQFITKANIEMPRPYFWIDKPPRSKSIEVVGECGMG